MFLLATGHMCSSKPGIPVRLPPESCFKSSGSNLSLTGGRLLIGRGVSLASSRSLGCLNDRLVPRDKPTIPTPRACLDRRALVSNLADIL